MDTANSSEVMDEEADRCNKNVHSPTALNIEKKVENKEIDTVSKAFADIISNYSQQSKLFAFSLHKKLRQSNCT